MQGCWRGRRCHVLDWSKDFVSVAQTAPFAVSATIADSLEQSISSHISVCDASRTLLWRYSYLGEEKTNATKLNWVKIVALSNKVNASEVLVTLRSKKFLILTLDNPANDQYQVSG